MKRNGTDRRRINAHLPLSDVMALPISIIGAMPNPAKVIPEVTLIEMGPTPDRLVHLAG